MLNTWTMERWYDEFLYWDPLDYRNNSYLASIPYDNIWIPDTTLYNSIVMGDGESRRMMNGRLLVVDCQKLLHNWDPISFSVKLTTNVTRKAVLVELLYPTIYKFSCNLNLRYFPFDSQRCTM